MKIEISLFDGGTVIAKGKILRFTAPLTTRYVLRMWDKDSITTLINGTERGRIEGYTDNVLNLRGGDTIQFLE